MRVKLTWKRFFFSNEGKLMPVLMPILLTASSLPASRPSAPPPFSTDNPWCNYVWSVVQLDTLVLGRCLTVGASCLQYGEIG